MTITYPETTHSEAGTPATGIALDIRPLSGNIGAEIRGVDLKQPLDAETYAEIRATWLKYKVVFFPGQHLTPDEHRAFTAQFGATVFTMLWGYPFLVSGEGVSPKTASWLLVIMTLTAMAAGPLVAAFTARVPYRRSQLVLGIVLAIVVVWAVVLLWPGPAPLWLLVLLVVVTAMGGPGSMVGFDLARTFHPSDRLGRATGVVNIGGFTASLVTIALIGVVLDQLAPGGQQDYTLDDFRIAMSVQFVFWGIGIVQLVRYRRKSLRHIEAVNPDAIDALRRGDTLLPGISRYLDP